MFFRVPLWFSGVLGSKSKPGSLFGCLVWCPQQAPQPHPVGPKTVCKKAAAVAGSPGVRRALDSVGWPLVGLVLAWWLAVCGGWPLFGCFGFSVLALGWFPGFCLCLKKNFFSGVTFGAPPPVFLVNL